MEGGENHTASVFLKGITTYRWNTGNGRHKLPGKLLTHITENPKIVAVQLRKGRELIDKTLSQMPFKRNRWSRILQSRTGVCRQHPAGTENAPGRIPAAFRVMQSLRPFNKWHVCPLRLLCGSTRRKNRTAVCKPGRYMV